MCETKGKIHNKLNSIKVQGSAPGHAPHEVGYSVGFRGGTFLCGHGSELYIHVARIKATRHSGNDARR